MKLSELLKTCNLTTVCKKADITRQTIYRYRDGVTIPSANIYCKICHALGVDPSLTLADEDYYKEN